MSEKKVAIQDPSRSCMKCLGVFDEIKVIEIKALGYGSCFDSESTRVQICKNCLDKTNPEWWNFEIIRKDYSSSYKYEKEIMGFVESCPIEGRELFKNRYSTNRFMDPQDWIDYELDLLSHEKCSEYQVYSPEERKAYFERFPFCKKVSLTIWRDGSFGTKCENNSSGTIDKTGKITCKGNIGECYQCKSFSKADSDIIDLSRLKKIVIFQDSR